MSQQTTPFLAQIRRSEFSYLLSEAGRGRIVELPGGLPRNANVVAAAGLSTESRVSASGIDEYWAGFFGLAVDEFLRPGINVVPHASLDLDGYQGIWSLRHHNSLTLSTPPELLATVRQRCANVEVGELQAPRDVQELLTPEHILKTIGPAFQGYLVPERFRPVPSDSVRRLSPEDRPAIERLKSESDSTDWEHSSLSPDDEVVHGYFVANRLVAACAMVVREIGVTDFGVIACPEYRGRGFAKAVVSASAQHAIDEEFLLLYQTLASNTPALTIAQNLGFLEYGQSLAVRLEDSAGQQCRL